MRSTIVVSRGQTPQPDTTTILDLSVTPPKVLGEVRAPTSVAGPPHSVAISPDRSIALVTASTIQLFAFDGKTLKPSGSVKVNGGPAGLRTAY